MQYSYMVIDFADLGGDFAAGLDFIRDCGYEGVELNLTPAVLGQLDAIEHAVEGVRLGGAVAFDRGGLCRGAVLECGRSASAGWCRRKAAGVTCPLPSVSTPFSSSGFCRVCVQTSRMLK